MKKVNILLIILGVIFLIVPYFINVYSLFRLLSILIGIIVLSLGLIIYLPEKVAKIIVIPLSLIVGAYLFDFFAVNLFNTYPIIAIKHKSSSKVETYNSLFYRVYSCDGVLTIDNNYTKEYLCSDGSVKKINVNKFLENPKESFKKSKNKFVHIEGKITTIVGTSSLTLSAYEDKIAVNGHVSFDGEKSVVIDSLNIDPTNYYVYDFIEVIGLVSSIKTVGDKTEIHLTNAKIIPSEIYDKYELVVNEIKDNTVTKTEEKYYYMGIQGIYYRYDENNIYELPYLLLDKRESIDNLVKNATLIEEEDYSYYDLNEYFLVKCKKDNIVFVNKNIKDLATACELNKD